MRSLVVLTLVAGISAWAIVRALPEGQADADVGVAARPQEIASISLDGRGLPITALRGALASKVGDDLDRARLERDRGAIESALEAQGYLSAKVAEPQITFGAGGGAFVTFAVEQGPLYRLRSVAVTGASPRDAGVVTVAAGEVALADRIAAAKDAIASRLVARGKRAEVSVRVVPDERAAVADLELAVR